MEAADAKYIEARDKLTLRFQVFSTCSACLAYLAPVKLELRTQDSSSPVPPVSHDHIAEPNWKYGQVIFPLTPATGSPSFSTFAKYHIRSGLGCTML